MTKAIVITNPDQATMGQFPLAVVVKGKVLVLREAQVFARCATLGIPKVKPGKEIEVVADESTGSAWLVEPSVDLGDECYRHPDHPGYVFESLKAIEFHESDTKKAVYSDTRPTIGQVIERLRELENTRLTIPTKSWRHYLGPWDEYVSARNDDGMAAYDHKWPGKYRWTSVYVVTGGSEGLYLHVDVIGDGKRKNVILAKTCSSDREKWFQCYESAAHIARYLHA